jgi:hypothetical protein
MRMVFIRAHWKLMAGTGTGTVEWLSCLRMVLDCVLKEPSDVGSRHRVRYGTLGYQSVRVNDLDAFFWCGDIVAAGMTELSSHGK